MHAPLATAYRDVDPAGIRREQLRLLFDALPTGLVAALINAALLFWVLFPLVSMPLLLGWFAALSLITVYRFYLLRRFQAVVDEDFDDRAWSRRFHAGAWLSGLAWGFAGYALFPLDSAVQQIFVVFVVAGMTAGAAMSLSAMWSASLGFMLPAIALLVLRLLTLDWEVAPVMALMGSLFLLSAVMLSYRSYSFTLKSIRARFQLLRTEALLAQERGLFIAGPIVVFKWRAEAGWPVEYVSPNLREQLGYSPEQLLSGELPFSELLHPEEMLRIAGEVERYTQEGRKHFEQVYRLRNARGEYRWFQDFTVIERDTSGEVSHYFGYVFDINAHKLSEEALRLSATAFEAHEAIAITDVWGNILRVNHAFTDITGYSEAAVLGKNPSMLSSGRHDSAFYDVMWQTLGVSGHWEGEIWNRRKSGEVYPEWLSITAVRDEGGKVTHYIAHFQDITERKQAEARIQYQAHFDALTELPNRRLLLERLDEELSRSRRHGHNGAVLFLDLDRFKTINDSLGHAAGDALLKEVALRIKGHLREEDVAARLGGDEFVVLLSELGDDPEQAAEASRLAAEKLREALAEPYHVDGRRLHTSPSIGIALFPLGGESGSDLLKQADIAMYRAKEQGRNAVHFYLPSMELDADERLTLETDLRRALDEGGQLCLHYQPQLDRDGTLMGAEALVRWQHPRRGLLAPGEFLPVAEASGLLGEIGEWVLGEGCAAIKRWGQAGLGGFPLAINISPVQLQQENFVAHVEGVLSHSGAEPTRLELEITEEMLLREQDKSIAKMNALRRLGVRFAIDDFGTGYSSLAYLRQLPAGTLKIDRTFVNDVVDNRNDAAIAETIIDMGRHMGMQVLAEGVENAEQLAFLAERGCDVFQGFYFSRPLEEAAFVAYAREHL